MDQNLNFTLMNNHPNMGYVPSVRWSSPVTDYDKNLLNKVCDYYDKRKNESLTRGSNIWLANVNHHHSIIQDLENRNYDRLDKTFSNLFSSPLTHGFCGGNVTTERLLRSPQLQKDTAFYIYDKLVSLAEFTGSIKVFDPGEFAFVDSFKEYLFWAPEVLLSTISGSVGVSIQAPQKVGSMFGITTDYGFYTERDFGAMALAYHISIIAKDKNIKICDIGGGAGHLAYYLTKFGFHDISIVDLPTVSIAQLFFLESNGITNVKLLSPDEFDGNFDIVINVDSMIEMNRSTAADYLTRMKGRTGRFISINTEKLTNEFAVKDVCTLKRVSRSMWYLNKGYVMEEYEG